MQQHIAPLLGWQLCELAARHAVPKHLQVNGLLQVVLDEREHRVLQQQPR